MAAQAMPPKASRTEHDRQRHLAERGSPEERNATARDGAERELPFRADVPDIRAKSMREAQCAQH